MSTENNFIVVGNVDDIMMVCKREELWDQCGTFCEQTEVKYPTFFAESSLLGLHPERERETARTHAHFFSQRTLARQM